MFIYLHTKSDDSHEMEKKLFPFEAGDGETPTYVPM